MIGKFNSNDKKTSLYVCIYLVKLMLKIFVILKLNLLL